MARERMTRRRFLAKAAAAAAGLGVLGLGAQCGATPTPEIIEKVVKETVLVEKEVVKEVPKEVVKEVEVTKVVEKEVPLPVVGTKKLVRFIVSSWIVAEVPTDEQARLFNDAHPDIEVKVESTAAGWGAEGWGPKVMSQIREKKLEWCGTMVMFPWMHIVDRAKSGMHVPMEEYIAASQEPGADTMLEDMIPVLLEDIKYEGHIYGIPYAFEAETFNYRKDLYDAAGWTEPPETWDELYAACADFKKTHEAEEILPYAWAGSLYTALHPYIHSATETPYTEDGLLDWMGAGVECFKFMRTLVEAGFTPPHGGDGWWETFQKGKLGAALTDQSRTVWGEKIWGRQTVECSPTQTKVKGGGAGTLFYTSCATLFQNAPYPQEFVDFLIWLYGPANGTMQRAVIDSGKNPVYQSVYDEIIAKDPNYTDYMWMKDIIDIALGSLVHPRNSYWLPQSTAYAKWAPQYFEKGSKLTAEETAKNILDEAKAEIAKML